MASEQSQTLYERAAFAVDAIKKAIPHPLNTPKIAIVCGSGLGGLAQTIEPEPKAEIPYASVPGFPVSTVQGHDGKLVFGLLGKSLTPVVLLVGRAHFYEGHEMPVVTFATRVCKLLGIETMIVTNAAGGLNPVYSVGDIVAINDHINLMGLAGVNPLRGPNEEQFGVRFPPLSDAYDLALRRGAHDAWRKLGIKRPLHEGVYSFAAGPTYETRAECRMLRTLGGDLVGMSTVPEVIVARHSGMRVLAFSLVTNKCLLDPPITGDNVLLQNLSESELDAFMTRGGANHAEVLEAGRQAASTMQVR
ncbi:hypothetical protein BT63DRAFT_376695 [Microthyrium microscopicum]|uniref:Purine nucleoside phosphorylase n=1 Tax=Microthyrium microscopicum TaxID=703497 RepID=A0A6A6U1T8_9PEZI|nr:hypothetical protein BT63DRAFT_376695 [Microthyrium microscopicum]